MRPNKIAAPELWSEFLEKCTSRQSELVKEGEKQKVVIAVENHLDFTVMEMREMVKSMDSPWAGVLFDVGNTIGTLDDPVSSVDILGPWIVATYYKDFAIEETARGFRFTMVSLGAGSLNLPAITTALMKYLTPGMGLSIELINGQQFGVNWLEDRFWVPFSGQSARDVAATLRHIRSAGIDLAEYIPESKLMQWDHEKIRQFEFDRMQKSIGYLRKLLTDTHNSI